MRSPVPGHSIQGFHLHTRQVYFAGFQATSVNKCSATQIDSFCLHLWMKLDEGVGLSNSLQFIHTEIHKFVAN